MYMIFYLVFILCTNLATAEPFKFGDFLNIVKSNKKIDIPAYPKAMNPSLIRTPQGLLLTFRVLPFSDKNWISYIGLVQLNEDFEVVTPPILLCTRIKGFSKVVCQSEDARIFEIQGKLYLIYNDNTQVEKPKESDRRDIFIAELRYINGSYILELPIKLKHYYKYDTKKWEKNWVPFEWQNQMLIAYTAHPHEILIPDFATGICTPTYHTRFNEKVWKYGILRGGTPAVLMDGEYLTFFHSALMGVSEMSQGKTIWHYFMGAYRFKAEPPFEITKMTPVPIIGPHFYTYSDYEKRVIFPGGFVESNGDLHIALGKDDTEIWICTIDKSVLYQSMVEIL